MRKIEREREKGTGVFTRQVDFCEDPSDDCTAMYTAPQENYAAILWWGSRGLKKLSARKWTRSVFFFFFFFLRLRSGSRA